MKKSSHSSEDLTPVYEVDCKRIIDSLSDGFSALDRNWTSLYANNKAGELLHRNPKDLSGTNFWDNYPDLKGKPIEQALLKAMNEQSHFHLEYYHESQKRWYEHHFYPSGNGMSIIFRDITERKKTQEELTAKSAQLDYVFNALDNSYWGFDTVENKTIYISPGTKKVYGYDEEAFLNNPNFWNELIIPEDKYTLDSVYSEINKGNPVVVEYRIRHADRSIHWLEARMTPTLDNSGKLIRVDGVALDISARKKNEERIKESEAKYRAFFENSLDGILLTVTDGEVIAANRAACEIFGMTEEEICNAGRFGLVDTTDPRVNLLIQERERTGKAKGEITMLRKDGTKFPGEISSAVFKNIYGKERTSMIVRDITERKKAENELTRSTSLLQATLESTNDGILVVDNEGKFSGYNGQFVKMWNIPEDIIAERDDAKAIAFAKEQLKDPSIFIDRVMELYNHTKEISFDTFELKDGRTFERYSQPQRMNDEIVGRVWSFRDVTERKMAESETKKITDQLIEVSSSIPGAVYQFMLNSEGKMSFVYVSDGIYELSGYKPDELYANAMAIFSVVDEENLQGLFQSIEISAATLQPWFYIFTIQNIAGKKRWIRGNSIPHKLANGDILWNGTLIDISDLKKAEDELKASELRYRSLVEQATDGIFLSRQNGSLIDVNSIGCQMLGYTMEEMLKQNISDIILVKNNEPPLQFDKLKSGGHTLMTRSVRKKDGSLLPVEINSKMLPDGRLLGIVRDITERKKAEEEILLKESAMSSAIAGIGMTDLNGKIIYANDSLAKMWGYAGKNELMDQMLADVFKGNRVLQTMEAMHSRGFDKGEDIGKRKDGTFFNVEFSANMIFDDDGNPKCMFGSFIDITERKKAENKLQESRTSLNEAQRLAHIGSWELDLLDNELKWSDEVYRIFGLEFREFNVTLEAFMDHVHPDDRNSVSEAYERSIKEKTNYDIIHRIITKEGIVKYVNERCETFYDELNTPLRSIGTVQDITERKKAEDEIRSSQERFRTLYEENPLMNFTVDQQGNVLSVNKRGATELGYKQNEFNDQSILKVFYKEDHQAVLEHIGKCILNPKRSHSWEIRKVTKSGDTIWVSETGTAFHDMNGNYIVMIVCENVTDRKNAEKELQQMNEQLRKLSSHLQSIREEERTSIAREIHDELGQQLTGLKMDASWLRKKIQAEDKVAYEKITGMIALLDETVKTVRRISTELRPGILDDLGLVDALDWQSSEFEKRTGIRCEFKSAPGEMQFEKNLSTGIFRVYQETLTNVARHSQATEIKTSLEFNDDFIILNVHDNGRGFDEASLKNKSTLGLIGMKERATMFGGKLSIDSGKRNGTTIQLQVPMKIVSGKTES